MKPYNAAILVSFALGCATPYQRVGLRGGFDEVPFDEDTYLVTFKGNAYTSRERVQMFLHYRCAELTLETGHGSFIVVEGESLDRTMLHTSPGSATTETSGTVTSYGNTAYGRATSTTTYRPGTTHVITKPGRQVVVRMFKGEKPDGAFDAASVVRMLGPRVKP